MSEWEKYYNFAFGFKKRVLMANAFNRILLAIAMGLLLNSCGSIKHVAYFQNADSVELSASRGLYDAKIMPKDILIITVITTDPKTSIPFNLSVQQTLNASGVLYAGSSTLQTYLVDNKGEIVFPIIGKLHVEGLTVRECENAIRTQIMPYLAKTENPVVTVKMSSFKVSVLGEVNHPGTFSVSTGKISVMEALAQAGDMTIYGKRDNVMLIREDAYGQKSTHRLNLNDANIINSPYYYLQQNDMIYVEPNKVKARNSTIGTSTTLWLSGISILTSVAALVVNIVKN